MNWTTFLNHTRDTKAGMFFCGFCRCYVKKHRWEHYKEYHRYQTVKEALEEGQKVK